MTTYAHACLNGHVLNISTNTEYIAGDDDHCPECGTPGITECQNCHEQEIIASEEVLSKDADIRKSDLDLYCRSCGNAYPWAGDDDVPTKNVEFLSTDMCQQRSYKQIISEINRCYRVGAYNATVVLVRKTIEIALIDIFVYKFESEQVSLYYEPEKRQHKRLSKLIDNFNQHLEQFRQLESSLDQEFIETLQSLRETGNAGAHSMINEYSEEKLNQFSNQSNYVLTILLQLKEKVRE
jgi:hypothetical protein